MSSNDEVTDPSSPSATSIPLDANDHAHKEEDANNAVFRGRTTLWESLSESIQYLYFLRFPLFFWLSLAVLALLDANTGLNALTRGIFTPPVYYAFGAAEFFVICLGMVSLLTARIICINGEERFAIRPPRWIRKSLGVDSENWAWSVLIISQVPGVYVLYRYHLNAHREHAVLNFSSSVGIELLWSIVGILSAVAFWRLINALYYWASCLQPHPRRALTLLWPRHDPAGTRMLQTVSAPFAIKPLLLLFRLVGALGPGYAGRSGTLFEGHQLAVVGAGLYLLLYIVLAPITAPTQQTDYTLVVLVFLGFVAAVIGWSIAQVALTNNEDLKLRNRLAASFLILMFVAFAAACATACSPDFASWIWFEHFPVLSAVAVLMTSFAFILCGTAFWADRYRIPVLTLTIVAISILQWIVPRGEHFFSPIQRTQVANVVDPVAAFDHFKHVVCHDEQSCPIIIVTASGGGIHAAAWTSMVLTELEKQFSKDQPGFAFHDHLFLMSTVSGGSIGAMPFLREYYASKPFDSTIVPSCEGTKESVPCKLDPTWIGQVRRAAFCSSLGGVGWGLEYGDLLRLLTPELSISSKITDRSQALEETLQRNLTERSCNPAYGADRFGSSAGLQQLTLAQMMDDLGGTGQRGIRVPAFSFNSTVAETGGRFLFSNYENDHTDPTFGVATAESWLSDYADGKHSKLDLSLVTAARLSATFPYVSSAARVGGGVDSSPIQHFIDGGYFDNDGTSTAIEFLQQLFPSPKSKAEHQNAVANGVLAAPASVPILFIEIRDGSDLTTRASDEHISWEQSEKRAKAWTPDSQIAAPLRAFWSAGHSSITRRNRRELELLMDDLQNRGVASFRHLVFDYQSPVHYDTNDSPAERVKKCKQTNDESTDHQAAQPLSWHLTANQEDEIQESFFRVSACSTHAVDWARHILNERHDGFPSGSPEVQCDQVLSKELVCERLLHEDHR